MTEEITPYFNLTTYEAWKEKIDRLIIDIFNIERDMQTYALFQAYLDRVMVSKKDT